MFNNFYHYLKQQYSWKKRINGKQFLSKMVLISLIFIASIGVGMVVQSNYISSFNDCLSRKEQYYQNTNNSNYNNYFYNSKIKYNYYNSWKNEKLHEACLTDPDNRFLRKCLKFVSKVIGIIFLLFLYSIICFSFQYNKNKQKISLINKDGLLKNCPIGFSFKTLLFGFFIPLARGDLKWFFVILIFDLTVVGLLSHIVFAVKYNKLYIQENLEKGYKPSDKKTVEILNKMGICYQIMEKTKRA